MSLINQFRRFSLAEWLVFACFFLSGLAALIYQSVWARLFSINFGTSELAIATVLAAYMGGLALGSALVARVADQVRRPVLFYALLEGGIGLTALAVPFLVTLAGVLYASMLGGHDSPPPSADNAQLIYYLISTFLIIGLPTACMGATLPILNRYIVHADSQVGPRTGMLYGLNTAGAVVGVLVGTFVFLPHLGLMGTQWSAVGINFVIFLLAYGLFRIAKETPGKTKSIEAQAGTNVSLSRPVALWIPLLMLLSGAVSFLYEVMWTRILGQVLGSSIYAFAIMLAAFLTGIALGGGLSGSLAKHPRQALFWLAAAQIVIAVSALGYFLFLGAWPLGNLGQGTQYFIAGLAMLPATVAIGATFPFAVRAVAANETVIGRVSARVYSWNTLGAIVGAVGAGFVFLPNFGFEGSARLALVINIALAILAAGLALDQSERKRWAAAGISVLIAAFILHIPRPASLTERVPPGFAPLGDSEELSFAVGRSSTVMLVRGGNQYQVRTNGLPEAGVAPAGSWFTGGDQVWLSILPLIERPAAESIMVIGLGGGVMLEPIPQRIARIDVVELEEEVVKVNHALGDLRRVDPLQHPNLNLIVNDARNALRLTSSRYDIVISQPSHPWTAGASHLFTSEFIQLVKARLNEDGVFLQWMNLEFIDESLLKSMAATLQQSFSHVRLYASIPGSLMFLASDAGFESDELLFSDRVIDEFSKFGVESVSQLRASLRLDEQGVRKLAAGAPLITDDRNLMATRSYADASGLTEGGFLDATELLDPLLRDNEPIFADLPNGDQLRLFQALLTSGQSERAGRLLQSVPESFDKDLLKAISAQHLQNQEWELELLRSTLRANPDRVDAQYLLAWYLLRNRGALGLSDVIDEMPETDPNMMANLRAWTAGHEQRWPDVINELAEVKRTPANAQWYSMTLEILAWSELLEDVRTTDNYRRAVDYLDRAIQLGGTSAQKLEFRANLARQLEDTDIYLYSADRLARYFADYLRSRSTLSETELASVQITAEQFVLQLRSLGFLSSKPEETESIIQRLLGVQESLAQVR